MPSPTATSLALARRFRGPERSGNGGYTAGLLASRLLASPLLASCPPASWRAAPDGARPVTVTLRQPPPLETTLTVVSSPSGDDPGVELRYDDLLVATAALGSFAGGPPAPVGFDDATAARSSYRGAHGHPFPGCFVCGPAREPGDGLRLTPGLVAPRRTACVWLPDLSLESGPDAAVGAGLVGPEFVWAALDCPGGWTSDLDMRPLVLGRMTALVVELPRLGQPYVVAGTHHGDEGRKTFTATALYDGDRLLARAEHVWLAVDPSTFPPPTRQQIDPDPSRS